MNDVVSRTYDIISPFSLLPFCLFNSFSPVRPNQRSRKILNTKDQERMMRPQTTTEPTSKQELAELYLKAVKELFDDEKDKYDMFHQFMTDFLDKRIDLVTAGVRVRELLKGHNNFINVFNLFLPRGYTITPDKDEPPSAKTAQLDIVVSFLDKVKERFCNEEGVYRSFLRIFAVPEARRNREEVYTKVSYHLKDHPDLLEEFKALYYY